MIFITSTCLIQNKNLSEYEEKKKRVCRFSSIQFQISIYWDFELKASKIYSVLEVLGGESAEKVWRISKIALVSHINS